MYGRLIWVARYEIPKIRKMRRTVLSVRTERIAPKASPITPPVGMTSGRISRVRATSSAVPTDSPADSQKTPGSDQPSPSTRMPASAGPNAKPIGPDEPKSAIVTPRRRSGVTSRIPASITPVLPSWNPISSIERASCHGSRDSATPGEHDRLDEGAADDDRLAAVLVGPDAPQRDERQARPRRPAS